MDNEGIVWRNCSILCLICLGWFVYREGCGMGKGGEYHCYDKAHGRNSEGFTLGGSLWEVMGSDSHGR